MATLTPLDGGAIKKSRASLVGGIVVAVGIMALWWSIAADQDAATAASLAAGAAVSALVGLWIWKADL